MNGHRDYEYLLNIINSAEIGLLELDLNGNVMFATKSAAKRLGFDTDQDLLGLSIKQFIHADDFDTKKYLRGVHSTRVELINQRNIVFPIEYWSSPIVVSENTVGYSFKFLDITERRRLEEELQQNEASLRNAQRIAHIGNWNWNIVTNELTWSDEIYRIFGTSPQQFGASYEAFIHYVHPDDREKVIAGVNNAVASVDAIYSVEHRVVRPSGEIRYVHEQGEVSRSADGKPLRMIGTVLDITDRKIIEDRLRDSQRELEEQVAIRTRDLVAANDKLRQLDQLKSMFIASMSHGLRTPLNSIIGFTGVMLKGMSGSLNKLQNDQLTRVYSSAKHLLSLISDIIDISKIEAGRVDVDVSIFNMHDLLKEAVENVKPIADEKRLRLSMRLDAPTMIQTDRTRLFQAVLNLLSNAIKFTEQGSVDLRASIFENDVLIEVTDTGIGIDKFDQSRVFTAFERFDSSLKVRAGGTGLGLYLTKKIVGDILQGTIGFESAVGVGSRFWIRIPVSVNERTRRSESRLLDGELV